MLMYVTWPVFCLVVKEYTINFEPELWKNEGSRGDSVVNKYYRTDVIGKCKILQFGV